MTIEAKYGVPTVAMHTDKFDKVVRSVAEVNGMPGLAQVFVPQPIMGKTAGELRAYAGRRLPPELVPNAIEVLDALPLGPDGAVDRAALPAPGRTTPRRETAPAAHASPTRRAVAEIVADVLSLPRVGAEDDFFELGGSSIQAARIVARFREAFGVTVSLRDFYATPTVAAVAAALDTADGRGKGAASAAAGAGGLVPITASGSRPPLICPAAVSGFCDVYLGVARLLGPDQPLYGLEAPGAAGERPIEDMVELAAHHVATIRERWPAGPYRLVGFSMAGMVAFEMALQLREAGERVDLLVLLDSLPPGPYPLPDADETLTRAVIVIAGLLGVPRPDLEAVFDGPDDEDSRLAAVLELLKAAGGPSELDMDWVRSRFRIFTGSMRALMRYVPRRTFDGRLTLLRARESPNFRAEWAALGRELEYRLVPGGHDTMLWEPHLPVVVAELETVIGALAPS